MIALGRLLQPLFGRAHFLREGLEQLEILAHELLRRAFELQFAQVVTSTLAEEVAHRRRRYMMAREQRLDAVLHHRSHAHQQYPLAHELAQPPRRATRYLRARDKIDTQQLGQGGCIAGVFTWAAAIARTR